MTDYLYLYRIILKLIRLCEYELEAGHCLQTRSVIKSARSEGIKFTVCLITNRMTSFGFGKTFRALFAQPT